MNIDLPPIDAATFWGSLTTIVSAPIFWVWRKIRQIESSFVTKGEFCSRLDAMEKANIIRTDAIRNDISRVEASVNLLTTHLLNRK